MSIDFIVIGKSKIYHAANSAKNDTVCGHSLYSNWLIVYTDGKRPSRKRMCSKCKAMLKVTRKAKKNHNAIELGRHYCS